jgi:uncharacterized protein YjbJ (UPF0337 family)
MNKAQLQDTWHRMKGEVKTQWGRLTNDDLEQVHGNLERLVGVIQERYGYVWERAQREVDLFRNRRPQVAAGPRSVDVTR